MKRITYSSFLADFFIAVACSGAHAKSSYQTSFESTYPSATGSAIDTCTICHSSLSSYATNSYGNAYRGAGHNFVSIESADSDGDGFTNIAEISALTFPGDPASKPSTPLPNKAPVADAGPDQTVAAGSPVTLSASSSSDADGTISKYAWTLVTGPVVTLSNPAAANPTFTAPDAGTSGTSLTFRLTVTDNGGLTATDTSIVNVSPGNKAPVANAGPDQTVVEGSMVTLTGSNSADPDGTIASYSWKQTSGAAVALSNSAGANPTFTAPSAAVNGASLGFQLTVTDNGGLIAADTCVVNVTLGNKAPVANAGPDQTVVEGASVTLTGSNSADPDGTIASYSWKQTAGTAVTLSGSTAATATFTAPAAAAGAGATSPASALTFQLTVTDNGRLTATDTCIVNVTPAAPTNQPPVADAGSSQTVDLGAMVTLDGSASTDPDDGVASFLWAQTAGTPVNLSNATEMSPTFTTPSVGPNGASLTFRLTVTDHEGLQSTDTCIVNINPGAGTGDGEQDNVPPEADAGLDQIVRKGERVTLDGSNSSDPDDGIVSYEWKQISGRPVSLSNSASDMPTFRAPAGKRSGASLTFRLTVTDQSGLKSSDTCVVNVKGMRMLSLEKAHDKDEDD